VHEQLRALVRAGLGQQQRRVIEVERGLVDLARARMPQRLYVQPACDHQVKDEKEIAFELHHDPLAEPLEAERLATRD
jgi:hypothetical protein